MTNKKIIINYIRYAYVFFFNFITSILTEFFFFSTRKSLYTYIDWNYLLLTTVSNSMWREQKNQILKLNPIKIAFLFRPFF